MTQLKEQLHKEEMKTFRCESNLNQLVRRSENNLQLVG